MSAPSRLARLARREPVRVRCYSALVALVAVLAAHGVLAPAAVPAWVALLAAVLVVPAAESARARVTPTGAPPALELVEDAP